MVIRFVVWMITSTPEINGILNKHLSLILSFIVTVAIWPREVVSCRDFILHFVATFWVTSLVGIYPGRARYAIDSIFCCYLLGLWVNIHLHLVEFQCTEKKFGQKLLAISWDPLLGWTLALIFVTIAHAYSRINMVSDFWGQFNKTISSVIYKCSHCFRGWIQIETVVVN